MYDLNNNNSKFNLPAYINIPLFLYQDNRLEKSALLIAAFFYSLHMAGMQITTYSDYLCALVGIKKNKYNKIIITLEQYGYIKTISCTNSKKIDWIYDPQKKEIMTEKNGHPAPIHKSTDN